MPSFAPLKNPNRNLETAARWLTERGFTLEPSAGSRRRVSKDQCVAEIEPCTDGSVRITAFPALVVAGEAAELVDRGYQKFFKSRNIEVAATAERLETLHAFAEQLKEALGYTSLYNEGLGSVSGSYQYDRVKGRELTEDQRPAPPWQK